MSEEEEGPQYWQAKLREHEEWPKRLEEICRAAEARWRSTRPWLAPDMCVSVPVRRVEIEDPEFP